MEFITYNSHGPILSQIKVVMLFYHHSAAYMVSAQLPIQLPTLKKAVVSHHWLRREESQQLSYSLFPSEHFRAEFWLISCRRVQLRPHSPLVSINEETCFSRGFDATSIFGAELIQRLRKKSNPSSISMSQYSR